MEGILTVKIANTKSFFVFAIHKSARYLVTAKAYQNAKVHFIQVKNDLWVSMKDVKNGLGVKNISDLVLKEIEGRSEKKYKTKQTKKKN